MKIVFLIRSLNQGGAQRQLINLAGELKNKGHAVTVCVFYSGGVLEKELLKTGVTYHSLEKSNRWDILKFMLSLNKFIRKQKPDVLHAYLGAANILSVLLKPFQSNMHVIWGVRASNMDFSQYDWVWRSIYFFERKLSRFADLIIVNSRAGLRFSRDNGFPEEKMTVISNGIDTDEFHPKLKAGEKVRSEWGIGKNEILIGNVARLDPKKDQVSFLKAAARVIEKKPSIKFVSIGRGENEYQEKLIKLCNELRISENIIWAGVRKDMPRVYNALDIMCLSSSFGEGFPNVIGEAMACGVPCVATDVGDTARIIGNAFGIIVETDNYEELAAGIVKMISDIKKKKHSEWSDEARQQIKKNFSINQMVQLTERALLDLL